MKQLFSLCCMIFLSFGISAQQEEKLLSACQSFDYFELERTYNCTWQTKLDRELVNGYFEQLIEIKQDRTDWSSHIPFIYNYEIRLIKKAGEIVHYQITRFEGTENSESIECEVSTSEVVVQEKSTNALEELKRDFQQIYREPLDLTKLFESTIIYGSRCGFGGSPTKYRVKLNQLVTVKDKDALISWLKSPNAEIQLYGIEGILILKESGVKFKRSIQNMIDAAAKKGGYAVTCSGCLHQEKLIAEIIMDLKKKHTTGKNKGTQQPANEIEFGI